MARGAVVVAMGREGQYGVGGRGLVVGAQAMHLGGNMWEVGVVNVIRCERECRACDVWPWNSMALWWNESKVWEKCSCQPSM